MALLCPASLPFSAQWKRKASACTPPCVRHIRLVPAPANTGIVFRRVDLDNFEIEAHARNVARVSYATSLMKNGVLLSTTEHLLAALYSCGIDNVYVEIDALELPILDGSAQPFIDMLEEAGIRQLRRQRRYLKIVKPLEISDGDRHIGIYPADEFRVRCLIDFPHPLIRNQETEIVVGRESFTRQLASARTFTFTAEIDKLRAMGLIRGGSLEPSVILSLQQARYVIYRITGNRYCFLLQPYERVQIEIIVLSPPAWLTGLSGEAHELMRGRLINFIKYAQVTDVPEAWTARRGLESADLGSGAEQPCRDFLYGHAALVAKRP